MSLAQFTIHTMLPDGERERVSCRHVVADNIQAAIAALRTRVSRDGLREGERPIGWSPEASKSQGGRKHASELWEEAKISGRMIYETAEGWEPAIGGRMVKDLLQVLSPAQNALTATDTNGRTRELQGALLYVARCIRAARPDLSADGAAAHALMVLGGAPPADDNVVDAEVTSSAMNKCAAIEQGWGTVSGYELDSVAARFGITRKPGETDETFRRRALTELGVLPADVEKTATNPLGLAQFAGLQHDAATGVISDAASLEYASWIEQLRTAQATMREATATMVGGWLGLSPDLQPSGHQVGLPHGSAFLADGGNA